LRVDDASAEKKVEDEDGLPLEVRLWRSAEVSGWEKSTGGRHVDAEG